MYGSNVETARKLNLIYRKIDVSYEAVNAAKDKITVNPVADISAVHRMLKSDNPNLLDIVDNLAFYRHDSFLEGAMYTYRILLENAKLKDRAVSSLSLQDAKEYFFDIPKRHENLDMATIIQVRERIFNESGNIFDQEKDLAMGMNMMMTRTTDRKSYFEGFMVVYRAIQIAENAYILR